MIKFILGSLATLFFGYCFILMLNDDTKEIQVKDIETQKQREERLEKQRIKEEQEEQKIKDLREICPACKFRNDRKTNPSYVRVGYKSHTIYDCICERCGTTWKVEIPGNHDE